MNFKRSSAAFAALAAGTLLLSACGSDNNTGTQTGTSGAAASDVVCGGK